MTRLQRTVLVFILAIIGFWILYFFVNAKMNLI